MRAGGSGSVSCSEGDRPPQVDTGGDRDLPARPSHSSLPECPLPELQAGDARGGFIQGGGVSHTGLFLLPVSLSLEVSVGKATTIYAVNGTEILLPCTFSSCFGFQDLYFWWSYNSSDTFRIVSRGGRGGDSSAPCALPLPPVPPVWSLLD